MVLLPFSIFIEHALLYIQEGMSSFHLAYPLFIFNILLFSALLLHSQTTHPYRFASLFLILSLACPKGFALHSEPLRTL